MCSRWPNVQHTFAWIQYCLEVFILHRDRQEGVLRCNTHRMRMAPSKVFGSQFNGALINGYAGSRLERVIQQPVQLQAHQTVLWGYSLHCSAFCNSGGAELSVSLGLLSKLYHLIAPHQLYQSTRFKRIPLISCPTSCMCSFGRSPPFWGRILLTVIRP